MPAPTPIQLNWLSKAAKASNDGFDFIRQLGGLASDFGDLSELQGVVDADFSTDASGTFKGFDPSVVPVVVQGVGKLVELLDANDGELRKAFKALAQRAY